MSVVAKPTVSVVLLTSVIVDDTLLTVIRALPITCPVINGDEPVTLPPPFKFIVSTWGQVPCPKCY